MKAIKSDRHGVTMPDGKRYSYADLGLAWRCSECGGRIEHRITFSTDTDDLTDKVECGRCGSQEFERLGTIRKEQVEAKLVIEGLPMELQKAVLKAQPKLLSDEDRKAAVELLY